MPLNLTTKFTDNIYAIHCDGAIVLGPEATALEALLDRCSHSTPRIILNLSQVPRLDSMGLGLIIRHMAALRKRNGDLRLAAPSTFVSTLLDHTLLSTVLKSFPTEAEALASFAHATTPTAKPTATRTLLLIDTAPDLCAFVRSILSQHGFDVRSIATLRDAKTLLLAQPADYLLIGPSNAHITPEILHRQLSPTPKTIHLAPDFKTTDAHQATQTLLSLFNL